MILIDDTEVSFEYFNSTEHYFRLIFARSVFFMTYYINLFRKTMIDLDVMYFTSQNQNIRLSNLAKKDL